MRGLYHSSIPVDDVIFSDYDDCYTYVRMFPVSYTITPSSLSSSSTGLHVLCWFNILATFTMAITIVTVAMPTTTIFIKDMAMEKTMFFKHIFTCY